MELLVFDDIEWAANAAIEIYKNIQVSLNDKKICNVVLTGGRSASKIYPFLQDLLNESSDQIAFYFGDERCVPPDHEDSNYALVMRTLFSNGIRFNHFVYKMYNGNEDKETAALNYEKLLPCSADLVILSLGDDGHIASLFPKGSWKELHNRRVICSELPGIRHPRISVTAKVLVNAKSIIVLASGKNKGQVMAKLNKSDDIFEIPARIALKGTWVIDQSAFNAMKDSIDANQK